MYNTNVIMHICMFYSQGNESMCACTTLHRDLDYPEKSRTGDNKRGHVDDGDVLMMIL